MESVSNYLELYRSRGLVIMPLAARSKSAILDDWPNLSSDELFKAFEGLQDYNIGLRLDWLITFDLERPELWSVFFKHPIEVVASNTWVQKTGKGFHVIFKGEAKPFKVDGFAELRSGKSQYIVVSPSIHPSGMRYEWLTNIREVSISELLEEDLKRCYHKLETLKRFRKFIEAMIECWRRYHRHHLALWVSGCMRKMGLSFEDAEMVLKTITLLAYDEEINDRLRALQDSYRKSIAEVKAWSGLREELIEITGSEEEARKIIKTIPIRKALLFEVKSLKELVDNAESISYISYPLLPRGCLIVLAGKGGVGKSLISLHIAHCVANGRRLFDHYDTKQTKVLIIDNENNPSLYRQRIEMLDLNSLEAIDVINFTSWKLDKKCAISKLKSLITANRYGLVIMDNWTVLTSIVEENKSIQVSNILTKLRKLAYDTNCSILLIHHLRKGLAYAIQPIDELRGSSVIVNEADLILLLERESSSSGFILKTLKSRLGEPFTIRLGLESATDKYTGDEVTRIVFREEVEVEADTNVTRIARAIIDLLNLSPGREVMAKEIIEALPYPRSEIYRAISYLVSLKAIERVKKGIYRLPMRLEALIEE